MARRQASSVDLAQRDAALSARRAANLAMGRHYQECAKCCQAGQDVTRYCDPGYQLAKAVHRATRAAERLTERKRSAPVQGTLW